MKPLLILFVSAFSLNVFAALDKEPCRTQKNMRMKIESITSNIANIDTTRTPEGGPYLRKELICKAQYCVVVSRSNFVEKYDPTHPDANAEGYVRYPDIDPALEMAAYQEANKAYQVAQKNCRAEKLARNE